MDRKDAIARAAKEKQDAATEKIAAKAARKAYANVLRDKFLDQRMDINVSVSGKDNERLYLKFSLFSAVWTHQFEKGDLIKEFEALGFKRVDFDNGWNYHVHYDFR